MNKLIRISIIHVLFCTFIVNFIRGIFFGDWHIIYTFITYTISTILLFAYQRWIDKKVLLFFSNNKHRYYTMSLALSYTIVGIIISTIMTVINLITYIIKISKQLMMYSGDSFSGAAVSAMLFHLLISVTVSGMTMQGLLDINKRILRNYK